MKLQFPEIKILTLILLRVLISSMLGPQVQYLKHYSHFVTPLNDMRTLKEAFSNYRLSGSFFADPNSINPPLALIRALFQLSDRFGESGILYALYAMDFLT